MSLFVQHIENITHKNTRSVNGIKSYGLFCFRLLKLARNTEKQNRPQLRFYKCYPNSKKNSIHCARNTAISDKCFAIYIKTRQIYFILSLFIKSIPKEFKMYLLQPQPEKKSILSLKTNMNSTKL